MRLRLSAAAVMAALTLSNPAALGAQSSSPPTVACDRQCLTSTMDSFLSAMMEGRPQSVGLTDAAEVRQNARVVGLDATAWKNVKSIRSTMVFADTVTGNVVSRAGVELRSGRPAYFSTRLKVLPSGRISDVEISADTSSRVVAAYVFDLNPRFAEVLPPDQRMSRDSLDALGRRYFQGLTDHKPVADDFDDKCDRYHSGQRITNTASNNVEGGPPRTCYTSNLGDRPWGPAIEQRFPIIDPDRGIVMGVTLLLYEKAPNRPNMYVAEVFKVVNRKILLIDNIGLMMEHVPTAGFAH